MSEETLVRGDADRRALDLTRSGLTAKLPGDLTDLRERLRRHCFTEAGETATRVDRDPTTDRRVSVVQQPLGLAVLAQSDVLVPVQLQCARQVVDLREGQVLGSDAGFLVRTLGDGVLE